MRHLTTHRMSKNEINNKKAAQSNKKCNNPNILRNCGSAKYKSDGGGSFGGVGGSGGASAIDEIDSLFSDKKKLCQQTKKDEAAIKASKKAKYKYKTIDGGSLSLSSSSKRNHSNDRNSDEREWVNDGLGGKYNKEGYTGRVEDGIKIFKAHILNKPQSGQTKLCPFDCDCCLI
mmetsp:Transcript_3410/g.3861  ORF Transcript_3410/g.3861 Transcript_3410/m.3861 type:complete len:174 (+) Transcript_3410:50-571(+)